MSPGLSLWEANAEWDLPNLEGHVQTCRFISKGVRLDFFFLSFVPCDPGGPPRRLGEDLPLPGSPGPELHAVVVS